MASTVLTIFIFLASAMLVFMLIVLVSPFALRTDFSIEPQASSGTVFLSWMHPVIVRMKFDIGLHHLELRVFGKRVDLSSRVSRDKRPREKEEPPSSHGPVSPPEAPEPSPSAPPPEAAVSAPSEGEATGYGNQRERVSGPEPMPPLEQPSPVQDGGDSVRDEKKDSQEKKQRGALFKKIRTLWEKSTATYTVLRRYRALSRAYRWSMRITALSFRLMRFDHFRLYARAGMDDPALLGRVYGWYAALSNCIVGSRKNCSVSFEPVFFGNDLTIAGSVGLRTSLGRVIMPAAVGLLTFPYLRAYLVWRRLKKIHRSRPANGTIG
ncbi:MAG: hypothetical protein JXA71_03030 [Chitinispirillaceae bacterium]|nr:hypothetical protein [Chitinispirillaceae bacterium]